MMDPQAVRLLQDVAAGGNILILIAWLKGRDEANLESTNDNQT